MIFLNLTWGLMGISTPWLFKKICSKFFDENFKDLSSNCPEQNGITKFGGHRPYKINIVLLWEDVETSLVLLGLRYRPLCSGHLEEQSW
jgi:hypothetical protein